MRSVWACLVFLLSVDFSAGAAVYHVDPADGPLRTHVGLKLRPRDTVLFRRGSEFRDVGLYPPDGTRAAPITLGAYGEGPRPKFIGPGKGRRSVAGGRKHLRFEGLEFSDCTIHGYTTDNAEDVRLADCAFHRIGGEPWGKDPRIHYGNAVEFWQSCRDVVVTNCVFDQIYDSGVTTQGPHADCGPFENVDIVGCRFSNFGMAALEIRDRVPRGMRFTGNVCRKGGRGFSSDGLTRPRNSEIWPEPMGHNVFVWRLDGAEPDGDLDLRGNDFEKPEFGENVYFHGVADAARAQIRMEDKR